VLSWADRFDIFCFLDNHEYRMPGHSSFECLLGAGVVESVLAAAGKAGGSDDNENSGAALARLDDFAAGRQDWLFGHLGYGLAKETESGRWNKLTDHAHEAADERQATMDGRPEIAPDPIGFPDLFFFVPRIVIELTPGNMRIGSFDADQAAIFEQIGAVRTGPGHGENERGVDAPVKMKARFSREEYLATVRRLQEHIHRGDCYEINFCQEFFSYPVHIDPLQTWLSLSQSSPNPFAACYKMDRRYLLCASPERYLKRTGNELLSQPIKGTWPREGMGDQIARDRLYSSSKDRAENVMVVDLVRNDLSKICLEGSVVVEELYGIYTFPQVHQMISSVKGELPPGTGLADCILATFPMGSMTGAPKHRVVGLIAETERGERGLFSGAVGYVTPEGDFDLNVVIRSILYNEENGYLSYRVGSGITFYSDPEQEYEECLWKAEGIKMALGLGPFSAR
jgi:para-aminobenzoate synthetase component 1